MKLRSSSFVCTPDEKNMPVNFKTRTKSLYESSTHSCSKDDTFKRYNTLPSDYVSNFSFLSLSETESMKSVNLSQMSDDCKSDISNGILPSDCDDVLSLDTISIYSGSTCDNEWDDVYSDITYQSSISRPVKRRKHTSLSDVNSEQLTSLTDTDLNKLYSSKMNLESEKHTSSCENSDIKITKQSLKSLNCMKWFASIALLALLIFVLLLLSMSLCYNEIKEPVPMEIIKRNLTNCLVGHEYSVPLMTDLLDKFITNYYSKDIHLAWIVGGIGVGKSYTRYLIKSSLASYVTQQSVIISLIPDHNVSVENTVDNLIKNLNKCKPNIIFIDGYDQENDVTLELLKVLFKKLYNQKMVLSISLRVLIFVIGTHKSSVINSHYLHFLKDFGSYREQFNFDEIQMKMYNQSPFISLNEYPHYFSVVPLLPLEVSHLEKCVISQLNLLSKKSSCNANLDSDLVNFLKQRNFTVEGIQKEVLLLSKLQPSKMRNLVPSGCKRVYQIVSSLLYFPLNISS